MSVYAYLHSLKLTPITPQAVVKNMKEQGLVGLLYHSLEFIPAINEYGKECRAAGLEFIPSFRYLPTSDSAILGEAMRYAKKLSLGNDDHGEWNGEAEQAAWYIADGQKRGYEWVCSIIHPRLIWDMAEGGELKRTLGKTQCFSLTGYKIAAYLFAEPKLKNKDDGAMWGHDAYTEYGLTIDRMRAYLDGMNVWSGAWAQAGINVDSRIYCKKLGFKDVVVGLPIDLGKSLTVPTRVPPERPPVYWGKCD